MSTPYISITGMSDIINCNIDNAHGTEVASATVECITHTLDIGDEVTIDIGFDTDHDVEFRGYVRQISRNIPSDTYTIELQSKLVRATDYFIISENPDAPLAYRNISAEDLIGNLLDLAGIDNYDSIATYFTFGITQDVEINLTTALDYSKMIADLITYSFWYDSNADTVYLRNRKPYPMDGTSGQPGDIADTPISYTLGTTSAVINYSMTVSEKDLRNKIVVYGLNNLSATAQEASPYLPSGFYKAAILATTMIDDETVAQNTADYNLNLLNRLQYSLTATVSGRHYLQPRKCIRVNISELDEINSVWYIYSAQHSFSNEGYLVNLELRR